MDTELFNVILIETQNACTRQCWFCKFGQERQDKPIVRMEWETIERIVHNLRDLKYSGRISWFWINEPLMEKRIHEILKLTRAHCPESFLSLITNGDLLDRSSYEALRENGLEALGVSVYDDKTFARVKPLEDERLVLLDMRHPSRGQLENRAGNVKQDPQLFERAQRAHRNRSCERPFRMMTVNPKGQAVLCCADMYSDVVMGDVKEHRLEEIWNNGRFRDYREALSAHGRTGLKLCEDCSYEGSSSKVSYPLRSRPH